jgi:hypothetical protein
VPWPCWPRCWPAAASAFRSRVGCLGGLQPPRLDQLTEDELMEEVWRSVAGCEGLYEVSSEGRVRSLFRSQPRILRPFLSGSNSKRLAVSLGRGKKQYVARIVASAFIGEIPDGLQVNHIDGDPLNNKVTNLEICTRSENVIHAFNTGLSLPRKDFIGSHFGERHGMARLTELDIIQIRARYRKTGARKGNGGDLAREFGVTHKQIHNIVHRKCWKSVA